MVALAAMKTINLVLISLATAATSFADTANGLNGNVNNPVPDSSSSALLMGVALVVSLLVGRKFIKK
jgi:hypothetical protein